MPSKLGDLVFSEPSGRLDASVLFSGSLIFASIYVYYGVLGDSSSIHELVFSFGFALSGIAESLPTDRRRTAGVLCVTAFLVLASLIAMAASAPELVVGER